MCLVVFICESVSNPYATEKNSSAETN